MIKRIGTITLTVMCTLLVVFVMMSFITILTTPKPSPKHGRLSYIPVLVDEHQINLIRGLDTIKLHLENAYALQEEFVVFIEY